MGSDNEHLTSLQTDKLPLAEINCHKAQSLAPIGKVPEQIKINRDHHHQKIYICLVACDMFTLFGIKVKQRMCGNGLSFCRDSRKRDHEPVWQRD